MPQAVRGFPDWSLSPVETLTGNSLLARRGLPQAGIIQIVVGVQPAPECSAGLDASTHPNLSPFPLGYAAAKRPLSGNFQLFWRPQRDSNPCRNRERVVS